jgi:hypothetical protein
VECDTTTTQGPAKVFSAGGIVVVKGSMHWGNPRRARVFAGSTFVSFLDTQDLISAGSSLFSLANPGARIGDVLLTFGNHEKAALPDSTDLVETFTTTIEIFDRILGR